MAAKVIGLTKNPLCFICWMGSCKSVFHFTCCLDYIAMLTQMIIVCNYLFFNSVHICINYCTEGWV